MCVYVCLLVYWCDTCVRMCVCLYTCGVTCVYVCLLVYMWCNMCVCVCVFLYTRGVTCVCVCVCSPQCSVSCGVGYEHRMVSCSGAPSSPGPHPYAGPASSSPRCPGPPPPHAKQCLLRACPHTASWKVGPWTKVGWTPVTLEQGPSAGL